MPNYAWHGVSAKCFQYADSQKKSLPRKPNSEHREDRGKLSARRKTEDVYPGTRDTMPDHT